MQVSATIIAAQQAAREARAALQIQKPAAKPAASFLAELGKQEPAAGETKPAAPAQTGPGPMRPGSLVNIII
jgi:hypothetical protein